MRSHRLLLLGACLVQILAGSCAHAQVEDASTASSDAQGYDEDAPTYNEDVRAYDEDGQDAVIPDERELLEDVPPDTDAAAGTIAVIAPVLDPNNIPGVPAEMDIIAFNIEYADKKVLEKLLDWAYDWVVAEQQYSDEILRAKDLSQLIHRTLNPSDDLIDAQEQTLLDQAALEIRTQQGLLDDDAIVHRGFIGRGMPLRSLKSLAETMHTQRMNSRRRLLEARDENEL